MTGIIFLFLWTNQPSTSCRSSIDFFCLKQCQCNIWPMPVLSGRITRSGRRGYEGLRGLWQPARHSLSAHVNLVVLLRCFKFIHLNSWYLSLADGMHWQRATMLCLGVTGIVFVVNSAGRIHKQACCQAAEHVYFGALHGWFRVTSLCFIEV